MRIIRHSTLGSCGAMRAFMPQYEIGERAWGIADAAASCWRLNSVHANNLDIHNPL
jgi:hypothetical protein